MGPQKLRWPRAPRPLNSSLGGGTFFKVGGLKCTTKNYREFLWFEWVTVTSQTLKYDVITYTPYEGLNYAILNKITLL